MSVASEVLERFPDTFRAHWNAGMRAKLGLVDAHPDDDALFSDLLDQLRTVRGDHTGFFRDAAAWLRGDASLLTDLADWTGRWEDRLGGRDRREAATAMDAVNPRYIPRNHHVEAALTAATAGDLAPFERLLDVVTHPFDERPEWAGFAGPAPDAFARSYQTFCGT